MIAAPDHRVDGHDAVADDGQGEHDRRPVAQLAAGLHRPRQQAPAEDHQAEGDGERELARHRRLEVAAVDAEALVQREAQPGEGEQLGQRVAESGQPAERPAAQRQRHQPGDGDQLERHAVGQDRVEGDDRQRRHDHVEAVHRACRRTSPCSSPTAASWAAGCRAGRPGPRTWAPMSPPVGVLLSKIRSELHVQRVEVDHVHHHDGGDDEGDGGDREAHGAARRPRPAGPLDRAAHDPTPGPGVPRCRSGRRRSSTDRAASTSGALTSSSGRGGASTVATAAGASSSPWPSDPAPADPVPPARSRSVSSLIATRNDASHRSGSAVSARPLIAVRAAAR